MRLVGIYNDSQLYSSGSNVATSNFSCSTVGSRDGHQQPCPNSRSHVPQVSQASVDFVFAVIVEHRAIRFAFVTFKNNVMVLSLRAMMIQFVALMIIAAFCFGGFLYALWT